MEKGKTKLQSLFSFKGKAPSQKKCGLLNSSSSSSSSLGSPEEVVIDLPDVAQTDAEIFKQAMLSMGNAMLGSRRRDEKQHDKKKHDDTPPDTPPLEKSSPDETPKVPLLLQQQQPNSQLDFLQRRRLAAAEMRIRRESEMEIDHRHQLLDMHYLPPVLLDATTLNRHRFQAAKAWAKATERVVEMNLNKSRRRKRDSFISFGRRLIKKTWMYLDKSTEHFMRFKLWATDLKWMECSFGSSMMITFAFLRWVFLLNFFLASIWICAIVVPFILHPPKTFDWTLFRIALRDRNFLLALQGVGIEKSWIYYGGYLYASGEQTGWYHTDYMYPLTIVATILISLFAVLHRIAARILESGSKALGVSGNVLYPFATLTFATWDFHVTSYEGATIMRRGIRMQFRERLADDKNKIVSSKNRPNALIKRYIALFILWPMLLVISAGCEFYLVAYGDEISDKVGVYADSVLISFVNNLSLRMVKTLVIMEDWKPATHERVGYCVAGCTENWVASELMGMILITTFINIGVAVLQAIFSIMWYKTKISLDITDFVVDIVYMQALVWITSCYSPLASLVGCFSNLVTFICFKNVLFYSCKPIEKPYSASRTSNLTYGMLLGTLLFSIIPIGVEFTTASASFCGPIHNRMSMYAVVNDYIKGAPKEFMATINLLSNTWLHWAIILGLVLGLVVMQAKLKQSNIFANLTKRELEMSRRPLNQNGSTNYGRLSIEEDVGVDFPL